MSKTAAAFVNLVMNDEELRQRTEKMKPEDAVTLAQEMGYDFTLEEFTDVMNEDRELSPVELEAVAGGDKKNVNQQKFIRKGVRKVQEEESEHCNNDFNAPLHIWIPTGHEEREVLWGIFGNYTKGYNLYKCSLCGETKEERV
jgi:predicted ribosomally synthesized peptide with nif11-like leader